MGMIETMKEVAELVQKADNIDLMRRLVEAQSEAMTLMAQVQALQADNGTLRDQLVVRDELVFENDCYWRGQDGPFCSPCWDTAKRLVRIHTVATAPHCPSCGKMARGAKIERQGGVQR